MTRDELFPLPASVRLFDAIPGRSKQLRLWDGTHDDWPDATVPDLIAYVADRVRAQPADQRSRQPS